MPQPWTLRSWDSGSGGRNAGLRKIEGMPRTDIYLKVEVDHDREESPETLASELVRQLQKLYVVRRAEMTNYVPRSEDGR